MTHLDKAKQVANEIKSILDTKKGGSNKEPP